MGIAERFGENLLAARRRAGLSQDELGLAAEVHRTEIGQLERGKRVPRVDTLVKLAAVLSVRPGDLLAGMEWAPGLRKPGGFLS